MQKQNRGRENRVEKIERKKKFEEEFYFNDKLTIWNCAVEKRFFDIKFNIKSVK